MTDVSTPVGDDLPATRLPRWSRGGAMAGWLSSHVLPMSRSPELPTPIRSDLAGSGSGGPAAGAAHRLVGLAAFLRVVATLTAETEVRVGHQSPTGTVTVLRVDLADRSWRELLDTLGGIVDIEPPAGESPSFDIGFGELPDAALSVSCVDGRWTIRYQPSQFDAGYVKRFGGYLNAALDAMHAGVDQACLATDLLTEAQRHHLVHERGGPVVSLPDKRWHELFQERAAADPDALAIVHSGHSWTYGWLNRTSNQIAHHLLAEGLAAQEVVAVAAERGPYWAAAIIGVLKAGGVYLPVEPGYPAARVATLLDQSRCRLVLTGPAGLETLADLPEARVLPLRADILADYPAENPDVGVGADQLAYIYFTSGSTGLPKGAMCEHLGMVNHVQAKIDDLGLGPDDAVVQNAEASFDISLWQLVAVLTVGGRSIIVTREEILDVRRFLDTVVAGDTSILQVVPSYLDVLLRHLEQEPRSLGRLRYVSVTGEAISKPLVTRWFARYPDIALVNAYGATEASDDTTHEIMRGVPQEDLVPVGRPVNNVTVYVLGPAGTLAPLGAPGEIAFSGSCVGRGYINDPERTTEAFGPDPFRPGERMYRTGDFGRWLPTGSLEFHGRRDEQVKVHGVRIELGEVESRILEHVDVAAASVVVTPLPGAGKCLVGFYTARARLTPDQLADYLRGVLPASAVPARLHRVDALPLTANGKVDKRQLIARAQALAAPVPAVTAARPQSPTEIRLAEAWGQVLNRPASEVGVADNFFDLGGSSLSALRLVASLAGLISLDDLVRNPVLGALASAVDGDPGGAGPDAAASDGLLRLLAGPVMGARWTLVCLPYAAGTAINFQPLAAAVAARDPSAAIYAVQPPGHDFARRQEPLVEVADLAAMVANEIGAQTTPVVLWGHCCGTALAVAVARLLGTTVRHLFLAARLIEPDDELARQTAMVMATADRQLADALVTDGGLDSLAAGELSPTDLAFIGRAYRHDTRSANQYLTTVREPDQRVLCAATVVVSTTDPATNGASGRYSDWGTFVSGVKLAEVDGGGHYFPRTRAGETAQLIVERSLV